MFTQLRFELKTLAWRPYLTLLVVLIGLFGLSIMQNKTGKGGVIFRVNQSDRFFIESMAKPTMTHTIIAEAETEKKTLATQNKDLLIAPQALKLMIPLVAALKGGDYTKANRLVLEHTRGNTPLLDSISYFMFFSPDLQAPRPDDLGNLITTWMGLAPNRLYQVVLSTSALNILTYSLNLGDVRARATPTWLVRGILLVAVATVITVFFTDEMRRPDTLGRVAPLRDSTRAALRGLIAWGLINVILILAATLVVLSLTLSPQHDLGLWRFPMQIPHDGLAQIIPLWQMLLRYLGLYNLWFLLFISLAHLVRQITKDASVAMFVLALVPFAGYFHLLDHLPAGLVRWLPSQYVNLPALVNHQLSYVHTSGWFVALVFAGWIIGLWLAATALAAAKRRVRLPLVTND